MEASLYPITVFYDRSCPLCRDEMHFLAARAGATRIRLADASADDFVNDTGVDTTELMTRIHGRRADGTLISGMALLRAVYAAAGLRWVLQATGWPLLRPMFDRLYTWVAHNRYRIPAWASHRLFRHGACRSGSCQL